MRHILFLFILLLSFLGTTSAANYLTFTAEADSSAFGITNEEGNNPDVQYSLNGGKTWAALPSDIYIRLKRKGDKALLKGMNPKGFSKEGDIYSRFIMEGSIAASGSVMSLIDGKGVTKKIPNSFCFNSLFEKCTSLTQAPELPATTLADGCYVGMFSECTSLKKAPKLPATTLADGCYVDMFSECTSLKQAPKLPATQLADRCYAEMFGWCTSLKKTPKLPATKLADRCYVGMFSECTSLKQAPQLPAT